MLFSKQSKILKFMRCLSVAFDGKNTFTINTGLKDVMAPLVCRSTKFVGGKVNIIIHTDTYNAGRANTHQLLQKAKKKVHKIILGRPKSEVV